MNLREEHECVVCFQVLADKLHTVSGQSGHSVFLGYVQSGHHSSWTDVNVIRIQEPVQKNRENFAVIDLHNSLTIS